MNARYPFLLAVAVTATLTTTPNAQVPDQTASPNPTSAKAPGVIRASHATVDTVDGFEGYGHAFKAGFRAAHVEFLPALGENAPHDFPLTFTLESVRRGNTLIHEAQADVEPTRSDALITYARGATIEERYEVSAAGVYQSFLFDSLPAGSGDLIVRGILNTELSPEATADGGLLFRYSDLGGVRFGAVTGIGANGLTAAGSLRSDGFVLELVLPDSFVNQASFPLLLDPLIGTEIVVDDSTSSDSSPEIASHGNGFLVVWERVFSLSHGEVHGQRLDSSGDLNGPLIPIAAGSGIARQPAAGFVSAESNYLVAYTYSPNFLTVPQVRCINVPRSVFGSLSASVAVAPGSSQSFPDVGGDRTGTDNEAFVVWQEYNVGIRGRTVTPTNDGNPTLVGSAFTIAATTGTVDPVQPRISKAIMTDVNFLVVWERIAGNRNFVAARMYDRNGNPLTGETALYNNGIHSHESPDCDGDGDAFMAVWQRSESAASSDYDIVCRAITWTGATMNLNSFVQPIEENSADNETAPSVAMTESNAIVAYLDQDNTHTNVYLKNVDPFTGLPAAEIALTSDVNATETNVAAPGLLSDDVLAVWDDTNTADILGQRYDGVGQSIDLGGGCGVEGRPVIPGAIAGNADFRIHLRDATPGVLAACVTGVSSFAIACGSCTLWPNVEVVYYDTTDANGHASVSIPLPPGYGGLTFYSQWVTFVPVGACPLAPIDLTDALRTTIDSNP